MDNTSQDDLDNCFQKGKTKSLRILEKVHYSLGIYYVASEGCFVIKSICKVAIAGIKD